MKVYYFTSETLKSSVLRRMDIGDLGLLNINFKIYIWFNHADTYDYIIEHESIPFLYSHKLSKKLNSNTDIIFSYNGISRRKGNALLIKDLIDDLDDDVKAFFQNILSVLEYKEDRIEANNFINLLNNDVREISVSLQDSDTFSTNSSVRDNTSTDYKLNKRVNLPKDSIKKVTSYPPSDYYFYDYLDNYCKHLWETCYEKSMSTHDVYKKLKTEQNFLFKKAFKAFISENPSLNLHSLKDVSCNKIKVLESLGNKRLGKFDFLYKCLENNGFKQISGNRWIDKDNTIYSINILPEDI